MIALSIDQEALAAAVDPLRRTNDTGAIGGVD